MTAPAQTRLEPPLRKLEEHLREAVDVAVGRLHSASTAESRALALKQLNVAVERFSDFLRLR